MPAERIVPYRPETEDEGRVFVDCWCSRCNEGKGECHILERARRFAVADPHFPPEWVSLPDRSAAQCTAFLPRPAQPVPMRLVSDRRQIEMPFPKKRRARV